eukprot:TRINITY_DN2461_c0_g4_i1.p1 TRINITY_DN2461_c0_g4~~TRINITY_DN2461_c0_g4_i1.p1  ORF type:complete len:171 (-),score=27.80 TRINITY_DN2461_c0_g4_i1:146-658(-)
MCIRDRYWNNSKNDLEIFEGKDMVAQKITKYIFANQIPGSKVFKKQNVALVVDDMYSNRLVIEADDGTSTVEIVKNSFSKSSPITIAFISIDLQMTTMNGVEATTQIRQLEQDHQWSVKIPIIAVTSHNIGNDREEFFKAEMQEFMIKPVSLKELKGMIKEYANELLKPK